MDDRHRRWHYYRRDLGADIGSYVAKYSKDIMSNSGIQLLREEHPELPIIFYTPTIMEFNAYDYYDDLRTELPSDISHRIIDFVGAPQLYSESSLNEHKESLWEECIEPMPFDFQLCIDYQSTFLNLTKHRTKEQIKFTNFESIIRGVKKETEIPHIKITGAKR